MSRWRKKPIELEAIRLPSLDEEQTPGTRFMIEQEMLEFVQEHPRAFTGWWIDNDGWSVVTIDRNRVTVPYGAYVVIDSKGYAYPCDAEIFEANHTAVTE